PPAPGPPPTGETSPTTGAPAPGRRPLPPGGCCTTAPRSGGTSKAPSRTWATPPRSPRKTSPSPRGWCGATPAVSAPSGWTRPCPPMSPPTQRRPAPEPDRTQPAPPCSAGAGTQTPDEGDPDDPPGNPALAGHRRRGRRERLPGDGRGRGADREGARRRAARGRARRPPTKETPLTPLETLLWLAIAGAAAGIGYLAMDVVVARIEKARAKKKEEQ